MSVIGGASQGGAVDVGDIGHSLRFRASNSAYLSKSLPTLGNRNKWTLSFNLKQGLVGRQTLISSSPNVSNTNLLTEIYLTATGGLGLLMFSGGVTYVSLVTADVFRDSTAHMSVVLVYDDAQLTASDRVAIYINGVRQTSFTSSQYPTQNMTGFFNTNQPVHIGRYLPDQNLYFDGYLSRIAFVDGQALTPDSFGYQNTESNAWVTKGQAAVKAVVDAGGTNSFMLDFDDGTSLTTLGYDKSSKGNNWTLNNFSLTPGATYDWMLDTPSNNFATWNPLASNSSSSSNGGNLSFVINNGRSCLATIPMSSGKWYCEIVMGQVGAVVGLSDAKNSYQYSGGDDAFTTSGWGYISNGSRRSSAGDSAYATSWVAGDVIGIAYDADIGTLSFYNNGIGQGVAFSGISVPVVFAAYGGAGTSTAVANANFGQRPFAYTPPTGFKTLCTANLPDGETITTSGSFTGNASADGPYIDLKGVPTAMSINGNAVTFGTHADKTAFGFKVRSSSASYNTAGSNTYSITSTGAKRKYSNGQGNP